MNSFEKLIQQIENKIVMINNTITKMKNVISLNDYIPLLDESKIWNLTQNEYEVIINNLTDSNRLTEKEQNFFLLIINMPADYKKIKKENIGLSPEQKEIFISIQNKIKKSVETYSKEKIEELEKELTKYKVLLIKLKNNDINIINEIELITEIINQGDFTNIEKIEIYEKINNINSKIFKNYSTDFYDEEALTEESLVETNLNEKELDRVFEQFGIKWEPSNKEELTPQQLETRKNKLKIWKDYLLKYGNIEKIIAILTLLSEKNLTFVFQEHEILTKTLLYSSVEQIAEVINTAIKRNIDYHELLEKNATILFPKIKEFSYKIRKEGPTPHDNDGVSGSLNNFLKNIELLDNLNIPASEVFKECQCFFIMSPKTTKKTYDRLALYGISFRYPDGSLRKGFSVLKTNDVLSKLDIAIECGCYIYYQDNISKLTDSKLNLYRIKYARSIGISESEIFKFYKNGHRGCFLPGIFSKSKIDTFGDEPADTFRKYNAVQYRDENSEIYDNILKNNDNDIISKITLEDEWIKKLDAMYKEEGNNLIYNFNGIIISRLKVLRYYQTLISDPSISSSKNLLLYVITKGSMLNQNELDEIKHCVEKLNFKGRELV